MNQNITLKDLGIMAPHEYFAANLTIRKVEISRCPKCGITGSVNEINNHDCKYVHGE